MTIAGIAYTREPDRLTHHTSWERYWWTSAKAPSGGRRCRARAFPHIGVRSLVCPLCGWRSVRTFALLDRVYRRARARRGASARHVYIGAVAECERCWAVFDLDDDATT